MIHNLTRRKIKIKLGRTGQHGGRYRHGGGGEEKDNLHRYYFTSELCLCINLVMTNISTYTLPAGTVTSRQRSSQAES